MKLTEVYLLGDRLGKLTTSAAVIGGFLIFVGVILLGVFALSFFKLFDPSLLVKESVLMILMWILLIVGILDITSGIILLKK